MKHISLFLFARKSIFYRLFILVVISLTCLLGYGLYKAIPYVHLPVGMVSQTKNQVIVEHSLVRKHASSKLTSLELQQHFTIGVPIYQIKDDLVLCGYVAQVVEKDGFFEFSLEILPQFQEEIFCTETQFEFLKTSPSLLVILKHFFDQEKMATLRQEMLNLQSNHKRKMQDILVHFKDTIVRQGKAEKVATQILEDPFIRERLLDALQKEVLSRIDWGEVYEDVQKYESTKAVAEILNNNINRSRLVFKTMGGGFRGIFSWRMLEEAQKSGGREFGRQFRKMLAEEKNKQQIKEYSQEAIEQLLTDIEAKEKTYSSLQAISQDEQLQNHLQNKYGEEAKDIFISLIEDSARDKQVSQNVTHMWEDTQDILKRWVESILLNEEKNAPNPMMLLALQKAISGSKPMVLCTSKPGIRVQSGYRYHQ